mmetsp:Transcript_25315/g.61439  ORF Transcript_25315/g.61439 Transcript_25315/m.61439 type:complete len:220 (-) Transcript_25315:149-808(-)
MRVLGDQPLLPKVKNEAVPKHANVLGDVDTPRYQAAGVLFTRAVPVGVCANREQADRVQEAPQRASGRSVVLVRQDGLEDEQDADGGAHVHVWRMVHVVIVRLLEVDRDGTVEGAQRREPHDVGKHGPMHPPQGGEGVEVVVHNHPARSNPIPAAQTALQGPIRPSPARRSSPTPVTSPPVHPARSLRPPSSPGSAKMGLTVVGPTPHPALPLFDAALF